MNRLTIVGSVALATVFGVAWAGDNPYYRIRPSDLFPTKTALLPTGQSYVDMVPDTLDLAIRAEWFIRGATQTITPSLHSAPAGFVLRPETTIYDTTRNGEQHSPGLIDGVPNWGKVMNSLTQARLMSPFDRNDANGTLSTQHLMMTNMLDWDVTYDLLLRGYPGPVFPQSTVTPQSVAMQSLVSEWRRYPRQNISNAIDEFVRMHRDVRSSVVDSGGNRFDTVFYNLPNPSPDTFIGYIGNYWDPFIHGKALRVMSEWYAETRNAAAFEMSDQLSSYVRNFDDGVLWRNPDPQRFQSNAGPGQFAGHIHSWLQAALGLATLAEARRMTDPGSSVAVAELELANDVYNFVKARTRAGRVGNFGESGSTGDMAILGIKLTEQGFGQYYDEIEAWTRNAMAETQIDPQAALLIPNNVNVQYEHTNIGDKVMGMFFADGTHVSRIPFNFAGGTSDYSPNTFAGMHAVWDKTVEVSGSTASIHFGLNRASEYLDVKSDLPYRGVIETALKPQLGPIDTIRVRVPEWASQQSVVIVERDASGMERELAPSEWSWNNDQYVQVSNVQASHSYLVKFPIRVTTEWIYEMRDSDTIWYEGSYPSPDSGSPERVTTYLGTFRGDTLVSIFPRPSASGGFPRYQRQSLASLPWRDVAPPMIETSRFVAGAEDLRIDVASGTQTQAEAGFPVITPSQALSVTKEGDGVLVLDAANSYSGLTIIADGTVQLADGRALESSPTIVGHGAALAVATGVTLKVPAVLVDGGTLSSSSLAVNDRSGIGALAINAGTLSGSPVVTVTSGGKMSLVQDARVSVRVGGLSVDQAAGGGLLDLGAGEVVVAAGGISAADLRADIIASRNDGSWEGTAGITSAAAASSGGTRAVGYVLARDGSARVSFAAPGDVNLNGQVNIFDLLSIDTAGKFGNGQAADWSQGDFNYDGIANIFDLINVDSSGAYGTGNYFPAAPSAVIATVPEPGSLGLVVGLAAGIVLAGRSLAGRRRA
jgi:autotransporter-associated beta strand protein